MEDNFMIACTENCKYQKNGECNYYEIISLNGSFSSFSDCAYFEEQK